MQMHRFPSLAPTVLCVALFSWAGPLRGAALEAARQDEPAIVKYMEEVGSNLRRLRRQVSDASLKTQNLQILESVEAALRGAREEQPLKTPELPESEREGFLKAYQEKIDQALEVLSDLRNSVSSSDGRAEELLAKLFEVRNEGHDRFKKPE